MTEATDRFECANVEDDQDRYWVVERRPVTKFRSLAGAVTERLGAPSYTLDDGTYVEDNGGGRFEIDNTGVIVRRLKAE